MGYYIEVPHNHGKAQQIIDLYSAEMTSPVGAERALDDSTKAVIVVCDNEIFEAAAFAYDKNEFEAFTLSDDMRKKWFLIMDRAKAKQLTNYPDM